MYLLWNQNSEEVVSLYYKKTQPYKNIVKNVLFF